MGGSTPPRARCGGGRRGRADEGVEEEVGRLKEEIHRLGQQQPDGSYKVKFGVLFNDDRCANIFEALVGTLRAAKKRKILTYEGELLLQGVHDNVEITLLPPPAVAAA